MKHLTVTSLLLLFLVVLHTQAQADMVPNTTIIPTAGGMWQEHEFDKLFQKFQNATCTPHVVNQDSDQTTIHVKLKKVFKIAFSLPDDTDEGSITHMIMPPYYGDFPAPIEGWEDINTPLTDADGNAVDFETFQLSQHPSSLRQGIVDHSSFFATAAGTYSLTFGIRTQKWTTDVYPCQYRVDSSIPQKKVTLYIQVDDN